MLLLIDNFITIKKTFPIDACLIDSNKNIFVFCLMFQDTFNRFFRRGRRPTGNKCYNTLSGRSSQINSHSNTDSCSRQSSLRYLEAEMARLHDSSRRPLVVSFRRKKTQIIKTPKQVTILDAELQNALNNLKNQPLENNIEYEIPVYKTSSNLPGDCSFIELHSLQPRHICPVNGSKLPFLLPTYPKVDDIELFKEQRFKLNRKRRKRYKNCENSSTKSFHLTVPDVDTFLTKSCTMPHMVSNECDSTANIQQYKCASSNSVSLTSSHWNLTNDIANNDLRLNINNTTTTMTTTTTFSDNNDYYINKYSTCQQTENNLIN